MSTHNIGFYEDLTKIIFELSSNIIKYAPYFFCWHPWLLKPHFLANLCKERYHQHVKALNLSSEFYAQFKSHEPGHEKSCL